jgi:hypothetical protein
MILALGKICYQKATFDLEKILEQNKEHDAITIAAALSYVRINRKHQNHAMPVIKLIQSGELSILTGATSALAYDDMIPSDEEIIEIIRIFDTKSEEKLVFRGMIDPRSYLISAMSKWKKNLTTDYLNKYLEAPRLKEFAIAALKGEKSRYE